MELEREDSFADPSQNGRSDADSSDTARLEANLRLTLIAGVGPATRRALLNSLGSIENVWNASYDQLCRVPNVGPKLARAIANGRHSNDAAEMIEQCQRHKIEIVPEFSKSFPRLLREIYDPPALLFVRGQLLPCDAAAVAIVGSRHATTYGKRWAARLAADLAQAGMTIVSGLARGADIAAHRGALEAGGRTWAVLASGVLNIYPPEHTNDAAAIAKQGAVLSEAPIGAQARRGLFPQRNRIISGATLGVIVVEAREGSGALITAHQALEQGREVFAVPGQIDNPMARGCHQLIRDGARLVESAEDVLEELQPLLDMATLDTLPTADSSGHAEPPIPSDLSPDEQAVLRAVGTEPTLIDVIVAATGLPTHKVLSTMSLLELRRLVKRVSGQQVVRCSPRGGEPLQFKPRDTFACWPTMQSLNGFERLLVEPQESVSPPGFWYAKARFLEVPQLNVSSQVGFRCSDEECRSLLRCQRPTGEVFSKRPAQQRWQVRRAVRWRNALRSRRMRRS